MLRWTVVVAFSLLIVSLPAKGDPDDELEFLAGAIETHSFLRGARGEPRSRSSVYKTDLERLNTFLAETKPTLERWHGLYQALRSDLANRGYQLSVDGLVGVAAGVGLRVGFGIEDRLLVRRPHLFVHGLWSLSRNAPDRGGVAGVLGAVTSRRYGNRSEVVGDAENSDPEMWGAAVVGYGNSEDNPNQFSVTAGVGGARVGAMDLVVLELPGWLWPFRSRALKLFRRCLVAEYDLIHQVQRLKLADAAVTLRRFQAGLAALEKEVSERLSRPASSIALSSAHPLASIFALYSSSAIDRYQSGPVSRFLHRCWVRMGLEE